MKRALFFTLTLLALPAFAQDPTAEPALPPGHPAINAPTAPSLPPGHPAVNQAADAPETDTPAPSLPPGHPTVGDAPEADPHAGANAAAADEVHRRLNRAGATAEPSADVQPGFIRVHVVSPSDEPVPSAEIQIGVLAQEGKRERRPAQTDATGTALIGPLPTGQQQAYRVNVHYQGATYSSTPFQLPPDQGYDVKITQYPVTHETRALLQVAGEVSIEIRDDRLHVTQQSQLANLGEAAFLFDANGMKMKLPQGFMAFASQEVMTDQHIEPTSDGFKLRGSLPPGRVTLTWNYDLPIKGSEVAFGVDIPFATYMFVVAAEAAPGLKLEATGMPPAQLQEEGGDRFLATAVQRSPTDPKLEHVTVTLSGIPGPTPLRWAAVIVAALIVVAAVAFGRSSSSVAEGRDLQTERERLLADARALEADLAKGEIGPQYHARRKGEIATALALNLRASASARGAVPPEKKA